MLSLSCTSHSHLWAHLTLERAQEETWIVFCCSGKLSGFTGRLNKCQSLSGRGCMARKKKRVERSRQEGKEQKRREQEVSLFTIISSPSQRSTALTRWVICAICMLPLEKWVASFQSAFFWVSSQVHLQMFSCKPRLSIWCRATQLCLSFASI